MPGAAARVAQCLLEAGPPLGISRAVDHRDTLQTPDSVSFAESQAIKSSLTIPALRLSVKSDNASVVKSPSVLGCPRGSDVLPVAAPLRSNARVRIQPSWMEEPNCPYNFRFPLYLEMNVGSIADSHAV